MMTVNLNTLPPLALAMNLPPATLETPNWVQHTAVLLHSQRSCKNIKVSNPVNCDRAWLKMFWWFLFLRTLLRMIHFYHLQANNHQNLFVLSHLKPCICIYLKLHEGLEIFCITFSVFVTIHSMKNVATFRTRNIFNLVLYNLSSLETLLFKKGMIKSISLHFA